MSATAIKEQIDQITKDERFYVAAYLQHLENEEDASYRTAVADSMNRMDSGHKVSFEALVARHETLIPDSIRIALPPP